MKFGKINQTKTGLSMKLFDYGIVYKHKKSNKVLHAIKTQDEIRKKTKGGRSLSTEIRFWRKNR